jgi:hypothetical protein
MRRDEHVRSRPREGRRRERRARQRPPLDAGIVRAHITERTAAPNTDDGACRAKFREVGASHVRRTHAARDRPAASAKRRFARGAIEHTRGGVHLGRRDDPALPAKYVRVPSDADLRRVRRVDEGAPRIDAEAVTLQMVPLEDRDTVRRFERSGRRATPFQIDAGAEVEPALHVSRAPRQVHAFSEKRSIGAAVGDVGRQQAHPAGRPQPEERQPEHRYAKELEPRLVEEQIARRRQRRASKSYRQRLTEAQAERYPPFAFHHDPSRRTRESKLARGQAEGLRMELNVAAEIELLGPGVQLDEVRVHLERP